jgi:hypothetical protein
MPVDPKCRWHWEILDLLRSTLEEEFPEGDPRLRALEDIEDLLADWCSSDHPEQHR